MNPGGPVMPASPLWRRWPAFVVLCVAKGLVSTGVALLGVAVRIGRYGPPKGGQ